MLIVNKNTSLLHSTLLLRSTFVFPAVCTSFDISLYYKNLAYTTSYFLNKRDYIKINKHSLAENYWCFLFCKENVTLLQGALKKLLTNPITMYFFIWEEHNTNNKKAYTLCFPLIKKCLQIANFIFWALFFITKNKFFNTVLTLNAIFFILLTM